MTFGGVALWGQHAVEVGIVEETFALGFEGVVAEQGVDARSDPVGVEDVGVL